MPLYDYVCSVCTHEFEELVRLSEYDRPVACPQCSNEAIRKLSAPMVKLEGITGDFPGAYMSWEKKRKQKMAQELKQNS